MPDSSLTINWPHLLMADARRLSRLTKRPVIIFLRKSKAAATSS